MLFSGKKQEKAAQQNSAENVQAQSAPQGAFRFNNQEQVKTQEKELKNDGSKRTQFAFTFDESQQADKELRKPRSRAYVEMFAAIDMLSATDEEIIARLKENMDEETAEEFSDMTAEEILEEIRATFQEEFQNLTIDIQPILEGVLSKCYIDGCDVHAITSDGIIMEHYEKNQPMPPALAKGRKVFHKYPDCSCVEVYKDCCRVIQYDSSVIKIMDNEI